MLVWHNAPLHKETSMSHRDDYTEKMKQELDTMRANLDVLEARAHEYKEDARHLYQENAEKLRHEFTLASTKFEELKAAGVETWDTMVAEMDRLRDVFGNSYRYFKSQAKWSDPAKK
jgi:hypothetical protein